MGITKDSWTPGQARGDKERKGRTDGGKQGIWKGRRHGSEINERSEMNGNERF